MAARRMPFTASAIIKSRTGPGDNPTHLPKKSFITASRLNAAKQYPLLHSCAMVQYPNGNRDSYVGCELKGKAQSAEPRAAPCWRTPVAACARRGANRV